MKKPKLPSRILVGNITYNIESLPEDRINAGVNGDCSNVLNHTIRLDPNLTGHDAIETLLHEAFHAIEDIYRIKMTHKQVYKLADALAHLIRHNPHITHWMEQIERYAEEDAEQV